MKIVDVRTARVQVPGRFLHLVLVETADGTVGLGESGLQRRPDAVDGIISHLRKWLVGQDARRIEYLWQRMFRGGFYPGADATLAAISAIDIALWDIRGKSLGVPVYELLGGRVRDRVECFYPPFNAPGVEAPELQAEVTNGSSDAAVELSRRMRGAGHRFVRFGPMAGPVFDSHVAAHRIVAQVAAVRADDAETKIMLDLHGRFSLPEARRLLKRLEPYDLYCVEDPIRSESLSAYRALRDGSAAVAVAAGEQWYGKWRFSEFLTEGVLDFLRPDVCLAGGITETRKIAALAEAHLVPLLLHNPMGPVCTAASIHLALALDIVGPQEVGFKLSSMPSDIFSIDLVEDGAHIPFPTAPGLGVELKEENLPSDAESTEPPHFARPDGSFTNY
jgi:galactonate dehydratase